MDQDGNKTFSSQLGYGLPTGIMLLGEKGGPGSGNYGHAGRPGMVGGSGGMSSGFAKIVDIMADEARTSSGGDDPTELTVKRAALEILEGYSDYDHNLDLDDARYSADLASHKGQRSYTISGFEVNADTLRDAIQVAEDNGWDSKPIDELHQLVHSKELNDNLIFGSKGGPGSGNWGHVGRPGLVGGSGRAGSGGYWVDYAGSAPSPNPSSEYVNRFLRGDGPVELWHVTYTDNAQDIVTDGLIPAKDQPAGQAWQASHSPYATYFFSTRDAAYNNAEQTVEMAPELKGEIAIIRATYPRTADMVARILPDEDVSSNPNDGLKALLNGESVAVIGGALPGEVSIEAIKELNDNLVFGSKEALETGLKEQFVCCESHAAQLFPDIIQDMYVLNYLTLEEMTKASMAPDSWVYSVSQAIIPTVLGGQDVLEAAAKEISRRLIGAEFKLGAKESRGLQTINQKIASLPAPIARTVRNNAKRLQVAMSATTKHRLDTLKAIPDDVWAEWEAEDELAEQMET